MKSYILVVTPAIAKDLLRTVKDNRSPMKNWVATLARDMKGGRWELSPQGLVLDEDGGLLDGQHRLMAVLAANVPVTFWVTEGVPRDMFKHLDGGRPRKMSDRLKISGYQDTIQLAAVSRRIFYWQNGNPVAVGATPSREELQLVIDNDPLVVKAAWFAHSWEERRPSPATAGFAWWLFTGIDAGEATWYMEAIRTGANLEEGNAALTVRNRIIKDENLKPAAMLAALIYGWNAYLEHRPLSRLVLPNPLKNENFPKVRKAR